MEIVRAFGIQVFVGNEVSAVLLVIAFLAVRDDIFVSPVLAKNGDQRELVNLELLVFGGMGIIKSPLLKQDISANKI